MEYGAFERDFITRTLEVIDQYDEHVMPQVPEAVQYEVTLLINCLLGLLVLPKEKWFDTIEAMPLKRLPEWGLPEGFVRDWGVCNRCKRPHEEGTLRDVVHRLRNSVAHLNVVPVSNGFIITEVEFRDKNKFHAVVAREGLRLFVTRLAQSVVDEIDKQRANPNRRPAENRD